MTVRPEDAGGASSLPERKPLKALVQECEAGLGWSAWTVSVFLARKPVLTPAHSWRGIHAAWTMITGSLGSSGAVLLSARALGCRDWTSGAGRKEGLFLWPKSQVTDLGRQGSTVVSTWA